MSVRIAAVQLSVDDAEPMAARVDRVLAALEGLAGMADFVVLPELWTVGAFNLDALPRHAQPLDTAFTHSLGEAAAASGFWLHAGSIPESHAGGISNTSVLFRPDGTLAASYRKIHLFGFDSGEAALLAGGEEMVVTPTSLGITGLTTCYDLRFPELFRAETTLGAQAFVIPASWPVARVHHWALLCRARAVENQALVIGCNAVGTQGDIHLGGRSVMVAPDGEVFAQAGDEEEILVASFDPALVDGWRAAFPVLADRRL